MTDIAEIIQFCGDTSVRGDDNFLKVVPLTHDPEVHILQLFDPYLVFFWGAEAQPKFLLNSNLRLSYTSDSIRQIFEINGCLACILSLIHI